ncbi:hypothetical protein BWQ93_13215 [Sphingopyxis sp. QXT-31]|uniref:DUF5990 family protein n=1 Tax=Sphingopyxis sp. QXT-31 TaxID=1357916 RepID=UPI0009792D13|nr:DUF5990 family protein [Sphingopyxis sp. QXT-31]APZ99334.1 hypothetical protein BWQ93_13215 [Sphingopyxis sp. QXT-31]
MARAEQQEIAMRIVIEQPVVGVPHSLQDKDGGPLDAKASVAGEPLVFDFAIRAGPGPKFFGDQVRREGPVQRFVYIRIGDLAGDHASPWSRRMKIDIHDIGRNLLDAAAKDGRQIVLSVNGTGKDGKPACATVAVTGRRLV